MNLSVSPWKINQLAEIETVTDGVVRNYASRIEDIQFGDLGLAMPMERGKYVRFMENQPVTVYVTVRGLYYFFNSNVTATDEELVPIIWVAQPHQAERLERRRFVRIAVDIRPHELHVMGPKDSHWRPLRGKILDISAGGICFTCDTTLQKNGRVKASFSLPDHSTQVQTEGEVVRLEGDPYGLSHRRLAGATFRRLGYREQEAIIKFVLRKQSEMIRRGQV